MITMMYCIGYFAQTLGYVSESDVLSGCPTDSVGAYQCYYEAYVRNYVFNDLDVTG